MKSPQEMLNEYKANKKLRDGALPASLSHWDAFPRYLVAELERAGITRENATKMVRVAAHNASNTKERIE